MWLLGKGIQDTYIVIAWLELEKRKSQSQYAVVCAVASTSKTRHGDYNIIDNMMLQSKEGDLLHTT